MKMLLGAVLLIALVTGGSSLICHKCNSLTGSCALNTTTECNRTIHETCRSISVNEVFGPTSTDFLLSGCGSCFGLATFNSGFYSSYVHTSCCSSNLCNDDVKPEIDNSTLNGLECHGCFAVTEAGCKNLMTTIKCRGQQDRCVHTSGVLRWQDPSTYVMKGCVSDVICRDPAYLGLLGFIRTTLCTAARTTCATSSHGTLPGPPHLVPEPLPTRAQPNLMPLLAPHCSWPSSNLCCEHNASTLFDWVQHLVD
ncbi:urokinase plasminogen activator surface receptor-like [Scyliorhinus canicula]|uniref:urokinase plasminogen activator surface receptor-like n=1 Tax=Scyliorhinus canicula TaxID=7830 RepID=UPI0018F4447E|nr:urokinase plasminogen activator surface receptor-like [Scyliorhinus canicula]